MTVFDINCFLSNEKKIPSKMYNVSLLLNETSVEPVHLVIEMNCYL